MGKDVLQVHTTTLGEVLTISSNNSLNGNSLEDDGEMIL